MLGAASRVLHRINKLLRRYRQMRFVGIRELDPSEVFRWFFPILLTNNRTPVLSTAQLACGVSPFAFGPHCIATGLSHI